MGGAKWLVIFLFDKESNFKIIKKKLWGAGGRERGGGRDFFFY